MKIAVLFDGAGLARLGLEEAGHECTGYELDPAKHHLSLSLGSGNCVLADALTVDLVSFDAIWASPPCQWLSRSRTQGDPVSLYSSNMLEWALSLLGTYRDKVVWVENVVPYGPVPTWGEIYNAAQFLEDPIQLRQRLIGGRYVKPTVHRSFARFYRHQKICPAITATEYKGCRTDKRRASRFYRRKLTVDECAYHQGLKIPQQWECIPDWYMPSMRSRETSWRNNIYEAIGNGVPVYMAKAFGDAYKNTPKK